MGDMDSTIDINRNTCILFIHNIVKAKAKNPITGFSDEISDAQEHAWGNLEVIDNLDRENKRLKNEILNLQIEIISLKEEIKKLKKR